ncbi:basic leucine zipper transcriptional factor ATF-like 2 isoform X2 [Nannospalax galili]|uniref:basic leucine zipper transcriptional factor ATF-like 2 isoform X2 n=1 Tax=Nannospalax galili TaxID=1026970 RepID=UPI000819FF89|nr:basic leucine zipper transcriptional factor ATF-like 2 isoform X2 [Nannospalax galili]
MHLRGGGAHLTGTDPEECQKQLKKKQKNRLAAQRSRQKHMDKADALHQHESLEKHNHALRKEIQTLQAELAWWGRTLHLHEHLCHMDRGPSLALLPSACPAQDELPREPAPHGHRGCQEQLDLFRTPNSPPTAQQLGPSPHCHESPGLLPSLLPSLSFDSSVVTVPLVQQSPKPVLSASPPGSSLPGSFSKLSILVPSPPAQLVLPYPLGLEQPTKGKLASSPSGLPAALGPMCPQSGEHRPEFSGSSADWQKLAMDPGSLPFLNFPLLSSAKVHF